MAYEQFKSLERLYGEKDTFPNVYLRAEQTINIDEWISNYFNKECFQKAMTIFQKSIMDQKYVFEVSQSQILELL